MTTPETHNETIIADNSSQLACSAALSHGSKTNVPRKKTKAAAAAANMEAGIQLVGYSIKQWCARRGFSESTYRNIRKAKLDPTRMEVGRRVIITVEADAEWHVMWMQGGEERLKRWQREQREKRAQRKQ